MAGKLNILEGWYLADPISISWAVKAVAALVTDERTRKTAAAIICAAVLLVVFVLILYISLLSGGADHN